MAGAEDIVRVLAITASEDDYVLLRHIFSHSNWELQRAATCGEGLDALGKEIIPVVLCDCELPDGDWRTVLGTVARRRGAARLIVTSSSQDDRLWAEVLEAGAYDLLTKPYDRGEVVRVVSLAWRQWRHEQGLASRGAGASENRAAPFRNF